MPVNFQQIQDQVHEMGRQAPRREKELREKREQARRLLAEYAGELGQLKAWVDLALDHNSGLRCGVPVSERLDLARKASTAPEPPVILAADGSQINPSRHDPVEFGVINVGVYRLCPGCGQAPQEIVRSELLTGDDLTFGGAPLTEEVVALRRDLKERTLLAELAAAEQRPVITLTDGPLELFREPRESALFARLFEDYLEALRRLGQTGAAAAGYVDKPRADLVVRLLELILLKDDFSKAGKEHPLAHVTDADLYAPLLAPGERGPVIGIQSTSAKKFTGDLALYFFYLNVGRPDHPHLARVEIPAWVAESIDALNLLHNVLVDQSRMLGTRPYPYALHRAHEVAVVSLDEKTQLLSMIQAELARQGLEMGDTSNKQALKDNFGKRTRYS